MDLAIPSFLIAIAGIVLQLADAFPEHRETRKVIVIMTIGFFLGIAANTFTQVDYQIRGNIDYKAIILFALLAALFMFALLGSLLSDAKKREAAGAAAWACLGLFLLSGFAVSLSNIEREPNFTIDEVMTLARSAEGRGDLERAIELSNQLMARLPPNGQEIMQQRITQLEKRQMLTH